MGKVYRVYRMDSLTNTRIPIGTVQERRSQSRQASNIMTLMKLAWQMYAEPSEDKSQIIIGEELTA